MKKQTNIRLSTEARRIIYQLSDRLSISQAAVVEMALREFAVKHKVEDTHAKRT